MVLSNVFASSYFVLGSVWVLALLSPGPDFFLIFGNGITHGFYYAVAAALGIVAGIEVWLLVTFAGFGSLVEKFPGVRTILSVIGGLYLMYLGYKSLLKWKTARHNKSALHDFPSSTISKASSIHAVFLSGLITNLANPKSLLFFGTLLVRFIPEGGGFYGKFIVWLIMTMLAILWFGLLAALSSAKRLRGLIYSKIVYVNVITGIIFIILGSYMIINEGI